MAVHASPSSSLAFCRVSHRGLHIVVAWDPQDQLVPKRSTLRSPLDVEERGAFDRGSRVAKGGT